MSGQKRKILVAVDGSEQSLDALRYVSKTVPPSRVEIVVFQVMSKVPEVFWDLGNDPAWQEKIESLRVWEQQQEAIANTFMNNAKTIFQEAGFSQSAIVTQIGRQKEGIARDIVAEARQGYDVVVLGRGKASTEEGTPLGSVASKVLGAASTFSLWLIGGKPNSDKVLIAMDSSDGGQKAVGHSADLLDHNNNAITLFHAIRGINISTEGMEDIFPETYRQQLLRDAESKIQPALQLAKENLEKMHIGPSRVSSKIITSVKSRAAAIVQEARQNGYGTIVVGRRGMTKVAEFSMGRVTNKLTQMARTEALCIVV